MLQLVLGGTFLWSGLHHLRSQQTFALTIESHGIFGGRSAWAVATGVTCLELALSAMFFTGINLMGSPRAWSIAASILLIAFFTYLLVAVRRGVETSCGCGGHDVDRLSIWTVARAAVLALFAGMAASSGEGSFFPVDEPGEIALAGAAALTIGTLLWVLPTAMSQELEGIL